MCGPTSWSTTSATGGAIPVHVRMAMAANAARSSYYETLDIDSKARYDNTLQLISGIDPYTIHPRSWSDQPSVLPPISYPDIVNFLVYSPSPLYIGRPAKLQRANSLQPVYIRMGP